MKRVFLLGYVVSTEDPEKLGRVQVELKGFPEPIKSPWLRHLTPYAGGSDKKAGWVIQPEVGDEVVLLSPTIGQNLGADDVSSLIVLGSMYHGKNKPVDHKFDKKGHLYQQLAFPTGHSISFDGKAETIKIVAKKPDTQVFMDNKNQSIKILTKGASVIIGKDDVKVDAKGAVIITAKKDVKIDAKGNLKMSAKAITIAAKMDVKIDGMNVKMTGKTAVAIKGSAGVKIN